MSESVVQTPSGRVLLDPAIETPGPEAVFDQSHWERHGDMMPAQRGRGTAYFVHSSAGQWVWRHFRRGGLFGRLVRDSYLFTGEDRVRSFAEWRLLKRLWDQGLPVPRPIAARYQRFACLYRADLMTECLTGAEPLSGMVLDGRLDEGLWHRVGSCLKSFHDAGVYHADLNAHNILVRDDSVFLIDFDRGRIRPPGSWARGNLDRLLRSLRKIAGDRPEIDAGWKQLSSAYEGLAAA